MPRSLEEISAIVIAEKFRSNDGAFAIMTARPSHRDDEDIPPTFGLLGEAEQGAITPGLEYRFYGRWENSSYGRQFKFQTFILPEPHTRAGIVRYLSQAPYIGQGIAGQLFDKFGGQAVRIVREQPEVAAAAVRGLTVARAQEAAEHLDGLKAIENCSIELIGLLDRRGFPKATAREALKTWGNRAATVIKRDPYCLMRFRGAGYAKCDAMYLDLGLPPAKLKRQALCAWHACASDTNGNTWLPIAAAHQHIKAKVGGVDVNPDKAITLGRRARRLYTRRDEQGCEWIAEGRKAVAEDKLAQRVVAKMLEESHWPDVSGRDFDNLYEEQRPELAKALGGPIGILGGKPGAGKSVCLATLVKAIIAKHGVRSIAVAAPTGKAAVRQNELLAEHQVPIQATTIHRLLRVESAEDGWSFAHKENNPLPFQFVAIDEPSMVDTPLMNHLFAACGVGTNILLCGDINQLPPVGHGAPLRDMIAAGLPYGELTKIHRNAGTIVTACHAISNGRLPIPDAEFDLSVEPPKNLRLIPAGKDQAASKIMDIVRTIKANNLADPIWDVQVIVAVNKKSPLSRENLNKLLQAELNPVGRTAGDGLFRVGDKCIQTKNGFLPLVPDSADRLDDEVVTNDKGQVFVANGEFGRVLEVEEKKMIVRFTTPERVVLVPRGKREADDSKSDDKKSGSGCDLELGFACTGHRMQGSSAPVVIVALDEYPGASGKYGVAKREWLYTSISRAKQVCFLVGKLSTARTMIAEQALPHRKTFLVELIAEYRERLNKNPEELTEEMLAGAAAMR